MGGGDGVGLAGEVVKGAGEGEGGGV